MVSRVLSAAAVLALVALLPGWVGCSFTNLKEGQGVLSRLRSVLQAKRNRFLARDVTILHTHRRTQYITMLAQDLMHQAQQHQVPDSPTRKKSSPQQQPKQQQ